MATNANTEPLGFRLEKRSTVPSPLLTQGEGCDMPEFPVGEIIEDNEKNRKYFVPAPTKKADFQLVATKSLLSFMDSFEDEANAPPDASNEETEVVIEFGGVFKRAKKNARRGHGNYRQHQDGPRFGGRDRYRSFRDDRRNSVGSEFGSRQDGRRYNWGHDDRDTRYYPDRSIRDHRDREQERRRRSRDRARRYDESRDRGGRRNESRSRREERRSPDDYDRRRQDRSRTRSRSHDRLRSRTSHADDRRGDRYERERRGPKTPPRRGRRDSGARYSPS